MEPYWPRYRSEARLQHRSRVLWRSVLPGYLFLSSPVNFRTIGNAPALRRVLRSGSGDVAELSKADMENIHRIEDALNDSSVASVEGIPFRKGQLVRVIPLDIVAKIRRIDRRRRVVVDAPLFGSVVAMTVVVGDIESV